jgi:hypothetical protein
VGRGVTTGFGIDDSDGLEEAIIASRLFKYEGSWESILYPQRGTALNIHTKIFNGEVSDE